MAGERGDLAGELLKPRLDSADRRVAEPADAILEVARAQRASLIAMATHGRSILARAVLGSVADRVARNADAPVLLFRPDPAAQWLPQAEAGPQVIA